MTDKGKPSTQRRMSFVKDEFGREMLVKDNSLQVMMEWEKPYMEACIDALQPTGEVLEIGFGLGYSATHIQKHHPKSHTIIECDPAVIEKSKEWAKNYSNINIIEGTWQEELDKLGIFDEIFFDDYSPLSPDDIKETQIEARELEKSMAMAQQQRDALEELYNLVKDRKFTDQELEAFDQYLQTKSGVTADDVISFIDKLEKQGNITLEQKEKFLKNFQEKQRQLLATKTPGAETLERIYQQGIPPAEDRLMQFFDLCLNQHMQKGSRMSSYIDYHEFKNRKPLFREKILSRLDVKYTEKLISVDVPSNCTYYGENQALVIVIEKT